MRFSERDHEMVVLGMILANPHANWVAELEKVLPPNGDLSSGTVAAIRSGDDKRIRSEIRGIGIEKGATIRRGILRRVIWHSSRKYLQLLTARLKWACDEQDRIEVTERLHQYEKAADTLLTRWEKTNVHES